MTSTTGSEPIRVLGHTADGRLVVARMTEPRWTIEVVAAESLRREAA